MSVYNAARVDTLAWSLECSSCGKTREAGGLAGVCDCGQPYLVRYASAPPPDAKARLAERGWTMWRYREWLPLADGEQPVTLGEGGTPLLPVPRLATRHGLSRLWVKDESTNPTGSFKARGLAAAVTRAVRAGATAFVVPTAGNAGVALAAYAARAGVRGRVYAPASTPATILSQIRSFGGDLVLVEGHIGDCGAAARAFAAETGAVDVSTLREPYRIEGKKTLGLELAEQLGWTLPDAIVYPTGGGTGLIGMWKAFGELARAGWLRGAGGGGAAAHVQRAGHRVRPGGTGVRGGRRGVRRVARSVDRRGRIARAPTARGSPDPAGAARESRCRRRGDRQ